MEKEKFKEILQQNGIEIRTQGRNEYILCPFHPDKNPSLIINNYNTFCFACKEKYSFKDVLKALDINLPIETDNPEVKKHIKLNQILENYFNKSHSRLLELLDKTSYSYIKNYLLKERNVKKEVIESEDIGVLIKDNETLKELTQYKNEYPETQENIEKLINLISKSDDDTLLFFYRNENFNISSIKFRTPRLQKRFQFKFWKKGKNTGIWGLKRINPKEKLLGVEGEFNLLAVKSVLPDTSIIALGSSTNIDFHTLNALIEKFDLEFFYCYDHDEAGFKALWEIKKYIPVYGFTTTLYNDLDEARANIGNDNEFINYLTKIIKNAKLFKHNTKIWNDEFYNSENFVIENNILYYLKDNEKLKVSTTPFIITKILNKYGIEYLVLKTKNHEYLKFPKELLLNSKKVISLTQKGFNFTTAESKYISAFIKELLDENLYPEEHIKPSDLKIGNYLCGDVILAKTENYIKEMISFREDGIWHIRYSDDFEYKKISGYKISAFDVFEHLLTLKKIYEFEYSNQFESYKENFKSIDEFAKKIVIDKKQYHKLSLAIATAINILKTSQVEKRLPDIRVGFYLSEERILYAGNWQFTPDKEYLLPKAVKNLEAFISQYPNKRKALAVFYSLISSAFAFVKKQLGQEAMIPILTGKGLTGKTTIVENLLKMFEIYREKSGQSINSYRRLAETVNENAIPVLINECENLLRNQSLVDLLKNIGGQDFIVHSDAKKEITFIAYSGLILTTNKIPDSLDTALLSRFVPIIYEAPDVIIDKNKYENNASYRKTILEKREKLRELSDTFHIIGKALVFYATKYSDEVIKILKTQHREPNSYIEAGRNIFIGMLEKFGIESSFFEPSYADTLEELTLDEETKSENLFISDIARKIREANKLLDGKTKEFFSIDTSVEEKIKQYLLDKNNKKLKNLLSMILPDYILLSERSTKVILRKTVINRLKINISGGFRSLCQQLGFTYTSRYGERIGVMDFEVFEELIKQALMIEDETTNEIDKLLSKISFPFRYDGMEFLSKVEFIKFYNNLSEEGKTILFEKLYFSVQ